MNAGRELDALVAEKVMGWRRSPAPSFDRHHEILSPHENVTVASAASWEPIGDVQVVRGHLPRYSTDIAAAWQVVEKMREKGHIFSLGESPVIKGIRWGASFGWKLDGEADTAPLAICLAALKAVGVEPCP